MRDGAQMASKAALKNYNFVNLILFVCLKNIFNFLSFLLWSVCFFLHFPQLSISIYKAAKREQKG